jgi:hypothetical protein
MVYMCIHWTRRVLFAFSHHQLLTVIIPLFSFPAHTVSKYTLNLIPSYPNLIWCMNLTFNLRVNVVPSIFFIRHFSTIYQKQHYFIFLLEKVCHPTQALISLISILNLLIFFSLTILFNYYYIL